MSNPLDPIWASYQTSREALKVVRRCVLLGEPHRDRPFRNTSFHKQHARGLAKRLREAEAQMNDLVVLSLYAAFEARLRDHVARRAGLLRGVARPDQEFGETLAQEFSEYFGGSRFGKLIELSSHAVGQGLIEGAGNIRKFRHWLAHGRRGPTPPSVTPLAAYTSLTKFLQLARLV